MKESIRKGRPRRIREQRCKERKEERSKIMIKLIQNGRRTMMRRMRRVERVDE
jgi:hypothetical protein